MRVSAGSDHAGFQLKALLIEHLRSSGHEVVDLGTHSPDPVDYPDFAAAVGQSVVSGSADFGICTCGTGTGMAIAANKVHGVRAAVVHDVTSARLAREHDDANVICIGARLVGPLLATEALDAFMHSRFEGGRHLRRVEKVTALEQSQA
ncbi:MAG: ribose 5-phosphate isomerase B [Acidimicrobiales bacterium]